MSTILVSACLWGTPCRYDGQANTCAALRLLAKEHKLIPVCPEELGGLPTPRPPAEIKGEKVLTKDGHDVTAEFFAGAEKALALAQQNHCCLAILKRRSPSCGCREIYDGTHTRTLIKGMGITAALLTAHGLSVIDETELHRINELLP